MHYWDVANSTHSWGESVLVQQCGITTGFHTYGMDIQHDNITFYYDRVAIWQIPNIAPGFDDTYDRPLYIMVNLAYGGAGGNNNPPQDFQQDLLVEYVKVWQGYGGSANAFATNNASSITWATGGLTLNTGQQVNILGVSLVFTQDGNLEAVGSSGNIIWQTNTTQNCSVGSGCICYFQSDGNFVSYNNNHPYWAAGVYNNNEGALTFSNELPYLLIVDSNCNSLWSPNITKSHSDKHFFF